MSRNVISVKTHSYVRAFSFVCLATFIATLFAYVHRINHKPPRKGPEIPSFVKAQNQLVAAKMQQLGKVSKPTKTMSGKVNSESMKVSYSFSIPRDWKFQYFQDVNAFKKQSISGGNCLLMTSHADQMPLWEAFALGKSMLQEDQIPFYSDGIAETEVSHVPAVIMNVRLNGIGPVKQSDLFVRSALFVVDHKLSITARTCQETSEDDFLRWLRSVQFELIR